MRSRIIEKILDLKGETEISDFENQLIQEGLKDIENGNTSTHEEVKKRFEAKFTNKWMLFGQENQNFLLMKF